jgi:hypothetical protein
VVKMSNLSKSALIRSVTADKFVKSPLLNRMGMQPMRILAAHAVYSLRPGPTIPEDLRGHLQKLKEDGYVAIPDFLPAAEFKALRTECLAALSDTAVQKSDLFHGKTRVRRILLRGAALGSLATAEAAIADLRLGHLFSGAEKRRIAPARFHCAVEEVTHGPLEVEDPENSLHSDTFHNTHKCWLYLNDVTNAEGPLAFVPRSHRVDRALLKFNYDYYSRIHLSGNPSSRRIAPAELQDRGLQEIPMSVPSNTLVIANTFGYHRRLRGKPGATRTALHVSVRSQPFIFWYDAASTDY